MQVRALPDVPINPEATGFLLFAQYCAESNHYLGAKQYTSHILIGKNGASKATECGFESYGVCQEFLNRIATEGYQLLLEHPLDRKHFVQI